MEHPTNFELLFDAAPVSLWLEDYSALHALFAQWRAQGVSNLHTHLHEDPDRLAQCAARMHVLRVNRHALATYATANQADLLDNLAMVLGEDNLNHLVPQLESLWDQQVHYVGTTVNYARNGRRMEIRIHIQVLADHAQPWDRVLVTIEDVTDANRAQTLLEASERHARQLFEFAPVSLWVEDFSSVKELMDEVHTSGITDFKTFLSVHPEFVARCMERIKVLDVNRLTLTMFGAKDRYDLLSHLDQVFKDEMKRSFAEQLIDLWHGITTQTREVVNYSLRGDLLHIHLQFAVQPGHEDDWSLVLVSLVDITARKKAEAYLEYLGQHDALTQLRNRAYFVDELNRIARRGPWPLSMLAMDLNGLKQVNDRDGHAAGDAMLRRVGEVLAKATTGLSVCVARTGGDEFVVLMAGYDERDARELRVRIDSILELNNHFYPGQKISLSIGHASAIGATHLEEATQLADQRMYEAKRRFYEASHSERRSSC